MDDFQIATSGAEGPVARLALAGELDLLAAPQVRSAFAALDDSTLRGVLVDLTETTFIDSTVLGVLVGASSRQRQKQRVFGIVCPSPSILAIFQITQLDTVLELFPTAASADAFVEDVSNATV